MRRTWAVIYVIVIALIYNAFAYVNHRVTDPFMIDASKSIAEDAAAGLVHTKQVNNFRLVNTSGVAVKLINIELQGYQGIAVSDLTVSGKPLVVQDMKSNRVNSGRNSWSTNNTGLEIEYEVEILQPKIQNPKTALITYSYLGIKHKQVVNLPGGAVQTTEIVTSKDQGSVIFIVIAVILLIIIYGKREMDEPFLGLKLIGYYYLGAFNVNINILIPMGIIIILFFFRPSQNDKVKMYASLTGFTLMVCGYLFQQMN